MKRMPMMVLVLGVSASVNAADGTQLPTRRVESVSVVQAESTAPVAAAELAPAAPAPIAPKAGSVSQWLQLQASGRVASPVIQRQTDAERELVNQRFLDSYQNPPESAPASSRNTNNDIGTSR
jgi:hypothetical protein